MSGDLEWVKQEAGLGNGVDADGVDGNGAGTDIADAEAADALATTDGTLLGGRIAYRQYRGAYRTGLEPVLMAAAVPARPGQRVLEAGCGAAAGLLCLNARVPGLLGAGIEQDAGMAALARSNLTANGLDWPVIEGPVQRTGDHPDLDTPFDHAFANPPWHRAESSRSTDRRRDLARRAPDGMLSDWIGALGRRLRRGGTLTLALPASLHAHASAAMIDARFGSLRLLPFWPKPGRAARIVLVQGVLEGRGDACLLPGLVLHDMQGFTAEAEAVLRDVAALTIR